VKQDWDLLVRGVVDIIPEQGLKDQLAENRVLRVKLGLDPTAADVHLGHTVVINKLKHFQDLGHEVIFLVGDFTACIGDPTGKSVTRQSLTQEEVMMNARTYQEQVFKILDPEKTRIEYNSSWLGKMSAADLIKLASSYTMARMLERDDFTKRYKEGRAIAIHEFLYPLLQGHDSVELRADVELGGTDQRFNLLVGRELQRQAGQPLQSVLTMPLLEGLDGVKKMSKSLNNYIGIAEAPGEIFGKIMSISDTLMWRYYELLSFRPWNEIVNLKAAVEQGLNPKDAKVALAKELVARFHDPRAADQAGVDFSSRFKDNQLPENLEEVVIALDDSSAAIAYVLKEAGLVSSSSEGGRMICQGAVKIDGEQITDPKLRLLVGVAGIIQVGKRRIARVRLVGKSEKA
jgi:tyrosyl-tRNA synthetase